MGILDGKRLLITGVLTDASLAFGVAKLAQEEGDDSVEPELDAGIADPPLPPTVATLGKPGVESRLGFFQEGDAAKTGLASGDDG